LASTGIHRYSGDESGNASLNQLGFDMLSITTNWSLITPNDAHEAKAAYGGAWKLSGNDLNQNLTPGDTNGESTMIASGTATDYWSDGDYIGIDDEVMQVFNPSSVHGGATVSKGLFGTIDVAHDADTPIWNYTRIGEWFKFWTSIYNVSEFSGAGLQLEIQTKPYDSFDSEVCHNSYDVSANVNFISLAAGELITGRFKQVGIQKPTAGVATAKLNRG
jgi:hypothetical protein